MPLIRICGKEAVGPMMKRWTGIADLLGGFSP